MPLSDTMLKGENGSIYVAQQPTRRLDILQTLQHSTSHVITMTTVLLLLTTSTKPV